MPITNPALYAVVSRRTAPPTHRRNITELRVEKLAELETKKKIDRATFLVDRLEVRAKQIGREIARLQKRKATACARISLIKDRILTEMNKANLKKIDGFETAYRLQPCGTPSLEVFDEKLVPSEYMRETVLTAPDKNAIKDALAADPERVPADWGCKLTTTISLIRT